MARSARNHGAGPRTPVQAGVFSVRLAGTGSNRGLIPRQDDLFKVSVGPGKRFQDAGGHIDGNALENRIGCAIFLP